MNGIAKNIKRQRLISGLNVAEFASAASVDETTALGWESGRIEPDIETLKAIAAVFDIETETLIYGKKTKPAEKTGSNKSVLIIALTVMGSLLTIAGVVVLFVTLYQKLEAVKDVLSFIPLFAGFACAFFAKAKKSGSTIWNEGGAAAWSIGTVITLALIFGSRNPGLQADAMLLLTIISVLPVVLIMKAIVPFLTEIYAVTHFAFYMQTSAGTVVSLIIGIVHIAVLFAFFMFLAKKYEQNDIRTGFLKIITGATAAVSAFVHICIFAYNIDSRLSLEYFVFILLGAVFAVSVICADSFVPGVQAYAEAGLALCVLVLTFLIAADNTVQGKPVIYVCLFIFAALAVAGSAVYSYSSDCFNALNCVETLFVPVFAFIILICAGRENIDETFTVPAIILSLVLGTIIIIHGVRSNSLLRTNTGMLTICAVALFLIIFSEISPLFKGFSVMAAGIVVLIVNSRLVRSLRKTSVKEDDGNA